MAASSYGRTAGAIPRRSRPTYTGVRVCAIMFALMAMWGVSHARAQAPERVYWAEQWGIYSANLDGSGLAQVVPLSGRSDGVALDPVDNKIYWSLGRDVRRANLDGTNAETVFTVSPSPLGGPLEIALDPISRTLFWDQRGTVHRCALDGSSDQTLFSAGGRCGLEVDPIGARIYSYNYDSGSVGGVIQRRAFDGSAQGFVYTPTAADGPLTLDPAAGRLYWPGGDVIWQANLDGDGADYERILTGTGGASGIAVDASADKIYWANRSTGALFRANLDGTEVEPIIFGRGQPGSMVLGPAPEPGTLALLGVALLLVGRRR